MLEKDIRVFFRDNTQWSQLLLLAALVVVYLYNFSVLPLEKSPIRLEYIRNQLAFLNMGLAGFVLSAISVRFIFPAVSGEGGAFWIIRDIPGQPEEVPLGEIRALHPAYGNPRRDADHRDQPPAGGERHHDGDFIRHHAGGGLCHGGHGGRLQRRLSGFQESELLPSSRQASGV